MRRRARRRGPAGPPAPVAAHYGPSPPGCASRGCAEEGCKGGAAAISWLPSLSCRSRGMPEFTPPRFQPGDAGFAERVRASFARQTVMGLIDARLGRVAPEIGRAHV